jgi:putative acetyltransferase
MFEIRIATRADEPAIQQVIRHVYDEYGWPWYPEDYHQDLYNIDVAYFDKGGYFWVAEIDGEVVGTSALEVFPAFPGSDGMVEVNGALRGCDCSLERLYLVAGARGKGIGKLLYNHTVVFAKSIGRKRMEIWSDKKLLEAHVLYQRSGAVRIGDRLCHDPEQSPEWGMVVSLS